eukprot:2603685-Prymnesium_polylepis.1
MTLYPSIALALHTPPSTGTGGRQSGRQPCCRHERVVAPFGTKRPNVKSAPASVACASWHRSRTLRATPCHTGEHAPTQERGRRGARCSQRRVAAPPEHT